MGIVWIASYPKSGNTWVRFLLVNYLIGPVSTTSDVEQVAPYVEQIGEPSAGGGAKLLSKTHFPYTAHPFAALTERSVYVVRHPKDVLLSNLNYMRLLMGAAAQFSDAEYTRAFIAMGGDPQWMKFGFGTLEEHLSSWLDRHARPLLLVRYEDLKADTARELTRIIEFLGEKPEPARIAAAVARSDFKQMREIELRERNEGRRSEVFAAGAPPAPGERPRYFMSEGRTTHSLAHIDPALDSEFDRRFLPVLQRAGYTPPPAMAAG